MTPLKEELPFPFAFAFALALPLPFSRLESVLGRLGFLNGREEESEAVGGDLFMDLETEQWKEKGGGVKSSLLSGGTKSVCVYVFI